MKSITAAIGTIADGRYRLDGVVGQGPNGVVYTATDLTDDELVAVKVLDARATDEELEAIRAHANTLFAVDPVFVPVLSTGRLESGACYLVRPFVKGQSWATKLDALGWLSLEWVVGALGRVAPHVDRAVAAGAPHGNLIAHNIVACEDGTFAVTDAGLTGRGRELALGEIDDDVRALAATAFELLTGAPPYRRGSAIEERAVTTLARVSGLVFHEDVEKAVARALWAPAASPGYEAATTFAAALRDAHRNGAGNSSPPRPDTATRPTARVRDVATARVRYLTVEPTAKVAYSPTRRRRWWTARRARVTAAAAAIAAIATACAAAVW